MNWNSSKQLQELLYKKLQLPIIEKTPKGEPSTGVKALKQLKGKHPIIDLLLERRKLSKLLTTYTESLIEKINIQTDKVHPRFNQIGTETGRLSSENPNGQQIPKHTEEGKMIRKAFCADKDCIFVSYDYSQIELRVLAHFSNDPLLLKAFMDGQDIHQAVSEELNIPRQIAKAVNFGLVYGSTEYGLSRTLNCPVEQAKQYIDSYFQKYKGVYYWMKKQVASAISDGYITILYGKQRQLYGLNSNIPKERRNAERQALNSTIQGSAAYIMKIAMIKVRRMLNFLAPKVKFILQIHDDLVIECKKDISDNILKSILSEMENAVKLSVPLKVNMVKGTNLGDLNE